MAGTPRVKLPQAVLTTPPSDEGSTYKGWSISDERQFVEGLVNTRLTIVLTVGGVIFAGALSKDVAPFPKFGLLLLGTLVTHGFLRAMLRAQDKTEGLLQLLREKDPDHPAIQMDRLATQTQSSVRHIGLSAKILWWTMVAATGLSGAGLLGFRLDKLPGIHREAITTVQDTGEPTGTPATSTGLTRSLVCTPANARPAPDC